MDVQTPKDRRLFEVMLIILVLGITVLVSMMGRHGLLVLNLFFLPVIVCGYFLGRSSAGVLTLLSVLSVTVTATLYTPRIGAFDSHIMLGLSLALWAATLGLAALLMGTLCDERARTVSELQKAYVGVVEVLFKYLQSSNPRTKERAIRIAEVSQSVAQRMRLSQKQIDDIRVAALLRDLESVEITTQLATKAVHTLERDSAVDHPHTFLGTDLVHSLGLVLEGALPLIDGQDDALRDYLATEGEPQGEQVFTGAKIISAVRAYDALTSGDHGRPPVAPQEALRELRNERGVHPEEVISALANVVEELADTPPLEPAYA